MFLLILALCKRAWIQLKEGICISGAGFFLFSLPVAAQNAVPRRLVRGLLSAVGERKFGGGGGETPFYSWEAFAGLKPICMVVLSVLNKSLFFFFYIIWNVWKEHFHFSCTDMWKRARTPGKVGGEEKGSVKKQKMLNKLRLDFNSKLP